MIPSLNSNDKFGFVFFVKMEVSSLIFFIIEWKDLSQIYKTFKNVDKDDNFITRSRALNISSRAFSSESIVYHDYRADIHCISSLYLDKSLVMTSSND